MRQQKYGGTERRRKAADAPAAETTNLRVSMHTPMKNSSSFCCRIDASLMHSSQTAASNVLLHALLYPARRVCATFCMTPDPDHTVL